MGKIIKHTDLSAEDPGPRADVDVRLECDESLTLAAGSTGGTGFGWLDAMVHESWDEDPGPTDTLEDFQQL